MMAELNDLEDSSSKDEFVSKMWRSEGIMKMEDHCPQLCTSISPSFQNFWDRLWKIFIDELKKELACDAQLEKV